MSNTTVSVVITTYNEGDELRQTVDSILRNTRNLAEVIVVDDGSQDGSCEGLATDKVRVIRHQQRIGIAYSRDEGSRLAVGEVLCYLDAHQRLSKNCLDQCAQLAIERGAITCPDIKDFGWVGWRAHGAGFELCPKRGYFSARWRQWFSLRRVTEVTGLRAPPYLIPRSQYDSVAWSRSLRGWGASEASTSVKAFFRGIAILHLTGPLARHRFQTTSNHTTTWDSMWRNQAIIARVCFDDATWFRHWLPRVFEPHLSDAMKADLEMPEVQAEHEEFLDRKSRSDREFWTDLLRMPPPGGV